MTARTDNDRLQWPTCCFVRARGTSCFNSARAWPSVCQMTYQAIVKLYSLPHLHHPLTVHYCTCTGEFSAPTSHLPTTLPLSFMNGLQRSFVCACCLQQLNNEKLSVVCMYYVATPADEQQVCIGINKHEIEQRIDTHVLRSLKAVQCTVQNTNVRHNKWITNCRVLLEKNTQYNIDRQADNRSWRKQADVGCAACTSQRIQSNCSCTLPQ